MFNETYLHESPSAPFQDGGICDPPPNEVVTPHFEDHCSTVTAGKTNSAMNPSRLFHGWWLFGSTVSCFANVNWVTKGEKSVGGKAKLLLPRWFNEKNTWHHVDTSPLRVTNWSNHSILKCIGSIEILGPIRNPFPPKATRPCFSTLCLPWKNTAYKMHRTWIFPCFLAERIEAIRSGLRKWCKQEQATYCRFSLLYIYRKLHGKAFSDTSKKEKGLVDFMTPGWCKWLRGRCPDSQT